MEYNLSALTTVSQCDQALVRYQGKLTEAVFKKTEYEAGVVSRATTAPLIPGRLESLQAEINTATQALAAAQSPLDVSNRQIELANLQADYARLVKRSLSNDADDILEDQLDIANKEQQIAVFEELIAAIEARKAELLAQAA